MNSQTITTRANANHFGRDSATASSNSPRSATAPKEEGKSKRGGKTAAAAAAPRSQSQPAADTHKETTFRLDAPSAKEVFLAGDFTDWAKTPIKMVKGGGGVWHTKVPLAPGRHLYRFVVDGAWHDDPAHTNRVPNPFGTSDTVLEIA